MSRDPIRAGTAGLEGSAVTLPTMTASPFSPFLMGGDRGESKVEHVEIRRSELSDAEHIQKLLNPQAHSYYGPRCDVLRILEHANLSLSLSYPHGGMCAHASFFDFPVNMRTQDQTYWDEWLIGVHPELEGKATPFNTLFLGLFLYQDVIKTEALRECLRTAFDLVPTLQYIFLVLPKGKHLVSVYHSCFTKCKEMEKVDLVVEKVEETVLSVEKVEETVLSVEKVEETVLSVEKVEESTSSSESIDEGIESTEDIEKEQQDLVSVPSEQVLQPVEVTEEATVPCHVDLYLAERHTLLPTLHVREAREEDSDDLSPLFLRHTEELHMSYGDYFLAELVTGGPNNTSLVAEVDGRAVGFIGITTSVDVDVLAHSFRLEPFHGLKQPCNEDEVREVEVESLSGSDPSLLGGKEKLRDSKQSSVKSLASLGQGSNKELGKFVDRASTASLASRSDTGTSIEVILLKYFSKQIYFFEYTIYIFGVPLLYVFLSICQFLTESIIGSQILI